MNSRTWRLLLLLSIAGGVLIAFPDRGERLFSLSRTHGPGALDAVGAAVIVFAWSLLWASVWRRRKRLPRSRAWWLGMSTALACGIALLVWSIVGDHGEWWLMGVAVVAGVQLIAAAHVSDGIPSARAILGDVSEHEARTYRLYVRFAAGTFLLVALYTVVVKVPNREFGEDWLHTVLHLLTGATAAYLGWRASNPAMLRAFTFAVLAGYGILGAVGWFTAGIALDSPFRIPLQLADNIFHGALAVASAATVVVASKRSAAARVVPAGGT